jgi:hypothetical protein
MVLYITSPRKGYKFLLQILIEIKVFCASPRRVAPTPSTAQTLRVRW